MSQNKFLRKETAQTNQSGLTLIEVMVSMVILGVVLVGLGQGLIYGIKLNSESKKRVASLNMCKQIMESLKTSISESQASFDAAAANDTTYYVDENGNQVNGNNGSAAFRVRVVTANWSDNSGNPFVQTIGGVTNVLLKTLEVSVVDMQNQAKTSKQIKMRVEIIRPSA